MLDHFSLPSLDSLSPDDCRHAECPCLRQPPSSVTDLLLHVRKEARCRELADERLFGRLCHDARPVAKKVELHTMSMEFTAVSLLLLVEGLPAGRQRLVPCVSNLDDQRCHFGLSATTERDRGFADSLLEGRREMDSNFRFRAIADGGPWSATRSLFKIIQVHPALMPSR